QLHTFNSIEPLNVASLSYAVESSHIRKPQLQSVRASNVDRTGMPAYHFRPRKNWMNGPMHFKGLYHLFYQYNPDGAVWGNIVWAHSVSKDLINWEGVDEAINASEPFDLMGCWSGSATILPGDKPVIHYTGVLQDDKTQVQNYAIPENSSDPYLRKWVKPGNNPVIYPHGVNASAFRDPTTSWWGNGYWKVLVGSRRYQTGIAYLYRSRDFIRWVKSEQPFHSKADTGMWECPDFFPVSLVGQNGLDTSFSGPNIKHVFKVSLDDTRYDYYTIGKYFASEDKYVPGNTSEDGWGGLRYDYGNFYASKSFYDPIKKRRILWGWANESDTAENDTAKGWAGIQLVPRKIWLDPNGRQLLQWPVEELNSLRAEHVKLSNHGLEKGTYLQIKGITAAQADVEVNFSIPSLDKAEPFDSSWINAQDLCGLKGSTVQGGWAFWALDFGLTTFRRVHPSSLEFSEMVPSTNKVLLCSAANRCCLSISSKKDINI
ncbi:Glycosyl hydrolase family 32, N-terminal, partial [Dillenia turbinata]